MESSATTDTAPAKKSRKFIALILGLVGLGLLTLICLGVGFYLFFDRVEQNVETMTQAVSGGRSACL
jgi:hypothetical protein